MSTKVAFFSAKKYDIEFFNRANEKYKYDIKYFESKLNEKTAILSKGFNVVCAFVNDDINVDVIKILKNNNVKLIALRSSGFNHVDIKAAKKYGIKVVHVPAYSPYSVAEHTIGLILSLNRKIHKSYLRIKENNFSLDGLLGFDLHGKTVGLIGTGKIGRIVANILKGFGMKILGYDKFPSNEFVGEYTDLKDLFRRSDIISLHCPLNKDTYHIINEKNINLMKNGVMIINTSRGGLIDTKAVITGLKTRKIGYLGLDVYEEEENIFFEDLSEEFIDDDVFIRLTTFPNVLITGHQGFFTKEALINIAETTLENIYNFENNILKKNIVV
ncbi:MULTISPECIES: 2-hydroxyacid dehydrogenase [unclassified Marinitoga]|uniref:2-hydroxyacid dehydrogenase n=1 Tax=unclassified Marinitoga TaxID=2640159 RepID=UPI0006415E70|nr:MULTISPECIES: 2-hydroxyacid dehydrogenase [unclassified Marinitoga]KLO24730.1 D-lactate dehydrogenase [Marinitoga sp. 1155]NUU99254.1 2-hydroxyacid dehydrogenase [Marinitoga sp. 1154]